MNPIEKKFLSYHKPYKLSTAKGNISSRWFIYITVKVSAHVSRRVKYYGHINRYNTVIGRYREAIRTLATIGEKNCTEALTPLQLQIKEVIDFENRLIRSKSQSTYYTKYKAFAAWCYENRIHKLEHVTPALASQYIFTLTGKEPTTINSYTDTLSALYNKLVRRGRLPANPFLNVPKFPEHREGKKPFTKPMREQLRALIEEKDRQLWMGCLMLFYCAIRPGNELNGLKVCDFNLYDWVITVPGKISKNKKTQGVRIPNQFRPLLEDWLKGLPHDYYFITRSANRESNNNLSRRHARITLKLGYSKRYTFYSWKHAGIYENARNKTMSLKELQLHDRHHSLDQMNEYLREMGIFDAPNIEGNYADI